MNNEPLRRVVSAYTSIDSAYPTQSEVALCETCRTDNLWPGHAIELAGPTRQLFESCSLCGVLPDMADHQAFLYYWFCNGRTRTYFKVCRAEAMRMTETDPGGVTADTEAERAAILAAGCAIDDSPCGCDDCTPDDLPW